MQKHSYLDIFWLWCELEACTPRFFFNQLKQEYDIGVTRAMKHEFTLTRFNQDIGNWNVGNVKDMSKLFFNRIYSFFNIIYLYI